LEATALADLPTTEKESF